jgi:hypothetical protein
MNKATPNADYLYIGAGDAWFDRFDASGISTGYRHLGNVEDITITPTVETLEKKSSMNGARSILKSVIVSSEAELSLTMNEYAAENLALAMLGTTEDFTQSTASVTDGPINGGVAVVLDRWYDLGVINPTITSLEQGGTPLAAADWEYRDGLVRVKSGGAATAAITTWNGTTPAITAGARKKIKGLSVGKIEGKFLFIGAADLASGPRLKVTAFKVSLTPDGALGLISEEFGTYQLKGKIQQDLNQPAGNQFYEVVELN